MEGLQSGSRGEGAEELHSPHPHPRALTPRLREDTAQPLPAASCQLPALHGLHPSDTQGVLLTQSILSTVPCPHLLLTLLSGSQDAGCLGDQRCCDICTQEAWGRVLKRVCWGCRGAARGQGEFPKSQVKTKKGPKFKKRKHQRLSLASRVLERWRWVNPGPQGPPPRADAALRAPVSHSDRRLCGALRSLHPAGFLISLLLAQVYWLILVTS